MTLSRRSGPSRRVRVREITGDGPRDHDDRLATEEPLEIRLAWPGRPAERLSVTMRTPGHDFELVAGFLLGEGLIHTASDLHTVAYCRDHTLTTEQEFNVVTAQLTGPPRRTPAARYDGVGAGSACGVCGTQSIEDVLRRNHPAVTGQVEENLIVSHQVLLGLPGRLRDQQRLFDRTGGLHAAGLFRLDGTPVVVREDVGRHNAVDKVVGAQLLASAPTTAPLLCVSGRIGFELVQKAVAAGVAAIVAVGAPSSLAVALAEQAGLCVVGFVRDARCVVYTVPDRIGV